MERYLLFDSGCNMCTKLAYDIEQEAGDWLVAHSLRDLKIQALLKKIKPNWRWEPTLLEIDGEQTKIFTGYAMASKILMELGIRRAWHIAQLVNPTSIRAHGTNLERRRFLKQSGALLTGLSLLGIPGLRHTVALFMQEEWQTYHDEDYGFELQFPADWQVNTTIKQPISLIDNEAIIKRVAFSPPQSGFVMYLDIWLNHGHDFNSWLSWYAETRLMEEMPTVSNASVTGQLAVAFLESESPNSTLSVFFGDKERIYRLMYIATNSTTALQGYWHMLNTFTFADNRIVTPAVLPDAFIEEAGRATAQSLVVPEVTTCCGFTSNGNPFGCCDDGNCVWWVYRCMSGVPFTGNAGTWWGQVPNFVEWKRDSSNPPTGKRSIAWQSSSVAPPYGHVAYIDTYSGGTNVNITDMCCGENTPAGPCWSCSRSASRPKSSYGGFIYRFKELPMLQGDNSQH